jgi:hypothetical protein
MTDGIERARLDKDTNGAALGAEGTLLTPGSTSSRRRRQPVRHRHGGGASPKGAEGRARGVPRRLAQPALRGRAVAPSIVGRAAVTDVLWPEMSDDETRALERSAEMLSRARSRGASGRTRWRTHA